MQHVNVLRHGFTQREREAQHDLEITVLKTWLFNSKYCLVYDTIVNVHNHNVNLFNTCIIK